MCELIEKVDSPSTAEELFDFLDVPYERSVITIHRRNILRHFHQYMHAFNLEEFNEYEQRYLCRVQLTRAYHDFERSTTAKENVFKIFQHA
jgi:nitrogenase-stabilizing/protective protein